MTPPKRSTLKLDLKDLKPRALTPNRTRESKGFGPKGLGRIGLVVIPTLTLVITIISINSPSASVSELDLLISLGVPAKEIYYSNPMKSRAYLEYASSKGVEWYALDSIEELRKIVSIKPDAKMYLLIS